MDINDLTCSNTDGNLTKIEFDIKRTKALLKCVKDDVVRGILLDKLHDLEEQKKKMEPCANKLCEEPRPSIEDVEIAEPIDDINNFITNFIKEFRDDLKFKIKACIEENDNKVLYKDTSYATARFVLLQPKILDFLDRISNDKTSKYQMYASMYLNLLKEPIQDLVKKISPKD